MNCAACVLLLLTSAQLAGPPPRFERLPNGLRVAIVGDHGLPLVSVQLWCRVGSAFDPPGRPGLCHVTRTVLEQRDDAALKLRAAGVRFESRTLRDACYFSSLLPPSFLEHVLEIEAARLLPIDVDGGMVQTALAAAARDYGLYPDNSERTAERQLLAALFPDHPYRHPPGFVAESLKDLKPVDVQQLLDLWFVPGNATLFIIGDVSTPAVLELVRKHFGPLPWAEPPRCAESKPVETGTVGISTAAPNRTGLDIAWLTPPAGYYENAAIDVLMQRLCNSVDGPLCERLLKLGCSPPRWRREAWRDAGMLVLSIDSPPGSQGRKAPRREGEAPTEPGATGGLPTRVSAELDDLERIVREELNKIAETTPTEIEHNRARALAARDARNRRAAFGDRARILAAHEILAGDLLIAEFELPRLRHIAVADVQTAGQVLLATRQVTLRRLSELLGSPENMQPPNAASARPLTAESPAQPANPPTEDAPSPHRGMATRELANGIRVTLQRASGGEVVEVRTVLRGDEHLKGALGALMAVGSTRHTVEQTRDYLSYHGLDVFPLTGPSGPGLRSRGPATHVAQMIELQAELILHPQCSEAACRAAAGQIRNQLRRYGASAASDGAERYLPPGLLGWVPAMAELQTADLREALRALELVQTVEVLVVADAEPETVFEAVELVWSDWSPPARANDGAP